jgi:coenzyme F420 hydrogenase subunit beta
MSSSGGCATALLLEAKRALDIDYIMAAGRRNDKPWLAAPQICSNEKELRGVTQQSTYQLFPHLCGLKSLLRTDPEARIAITALPCQVQALRKLQSLNGPIAEYARSKIAIIIEIACSSNTLALATERLITEFLRISLDEVKDVRYRDGAYPGDFCVYTKQNGRHIIEFWKAADFFKKHKTHRCLSCGDWMSGLADLSLCDGDPNIFMSSAVPNKRLIKHGRILVRTSLGNHVVDKAIATGAIDILDRQLNRMNLGLERKRNRRAHYERSRLIIPDSPIRGYAEKTEPISDDYLLKLSRTQKDESIQTETFKYADAQR